MYESALTTALRVRLIGNWFIICLQNCYLNMNGWTDKAMSRFFSDRDAVGMVMGSGTVGNSLRYSCVLLLLCTRAQAVQHDKPSNIL